MNKARPYRAGKQLGEAIKETGNILYLMDNREQYLQGVKDVIDKEVRHVRKINRGKKQ